MNSSFHIFTPNLYKDFLLVFYVSSAVGLRSCLEDLNRLPLLAYGVAVAQSAVNRWVVGSNPTMPALNYIKL